MTWWRERLNQVVRLVLNTAVDADSRRWPVRLTRLLLRTHPTLYMIYCYRVGWLREVLRLSTARAIHSEVLQRAVRRSEEMCQVLDSELVLVDEAKPETPCRYNGRILLVFHSAGSFDPAGYTVRSNALMRALTQENVSFSACTRYGYPWDLASHRDESQCPQSVTDGFTVRHFPDPEELIGDCDSRYLEEYVKQLCALASQERVSVIHAASSFLNGLAAAKAARRLGVGSVYEMRGLWHVSRCVTEPQFRHTEHFAYCEAMEVEAARRCDRVVVISGALREWLVERGVESDKIHAIPNAAEIGGSPELDMLDTGSDDADQDGVTVGFIGSLTRYEGVDLIIKAVARLAPRFPELRCVIAGDGRERATLERLCRRLRCQAHVTFLGRVPRQEVARLYQSIDVFPLPRRRYEVCELVPPLKPLEIMAHQRALIVSDVAPLKELVVQGQTGLICSADDVDSLTESIARLCEDLNLRDQVARKGRKWVEAERNWAQNGRLYAELYSRLSSFETTVDAAVDIKHG